MFILYKLICISLEGFEPTTSNSTGWYHSQMISMSRNVSLLPIYQVLPQQEPERLAEAHQNKRFGHLSDEYLLRIQDIFQNMSSFSPKK